MTEHFTLEEFTDSAKAKELGIDNNPPAAMYDAIGHTLEGMERVRKVLGHAVIILSGYRCESLNEAIGGSVKSQHIKGEACDFICPKYGSPLEVAKKIAKNQKTIKYDQLIFEHRGSAAWVHISFGKRDRRQDLTFKDGTYTRGIV